MRYFFDFLALLPKALSGSQEQEQSDQGLFALLPRETLDVITDELGPKDLVSLTLASKSCYSLFQPPLFKYASANLMKKVWHRQQDAVAKLIANEPDSDRNLLNIDLRKQRLGSRLNRNHLPWYKAAWTENRELYYFLVEKQLEVNGNNPDIAALPSTLVARLMGVDNNRNIAKLVGCSGGYHELYFLIITGFENEGLLKTYERFRATTFLKRIFEHDPKLARQLLLTKGPDGRPSLLQWVYSERDKSMLTEFLQTFTECPAEVARQRAQIDATLSPKDKFQLDMQIILCNLPENDGDKEDLQALIKSQLGEAKANGWKINIEELLNAYSKLIKLGNVAELQWDKLNAAETRVQQLLGELSRVFLDIPLFHTNGPNDETRDFYAVDAPRTFKFWEDGSESLFPELYQELGESCFIYRGFYDNFPAQCAKGWGAWAPMVFTDKSAVVRAGKVSDEQLDFIEENLSPAPKPNLGHGF